MERRERKETIYDMSFASLQSPMELQTVLCYITPFLCAHTRCSPHEIRTYVPCSYSCVRFTSVTHVYAVFPSVWFRRLHSARASSLSIFSRRKCEHAFFLGGEGHGNTKSGDSGCCDTAIIEDAPSRYQSTSRTADDGSGRPSGSRFSSPEVVCQRCKFTFSRVNPKASSLNASMNDC